MRKYLFLIVVLLSLTAVNVLAKKAESLDQAKTLSAELKLPILLEFVHED